MTIKKHAVFQFLTILALFCTLSLQADANCSFQEKKVSGRYLGSYTTAELNQRRLSAFASSKAPAPPFPLLDLIQRDLLARKKSSTRHQRVGFNFISASLSDSPQGPATIPTNQNGWVGEKQYILMTYQSIRSFDKKTGLPDGALDTDAFGFFGSNFNVDVRIEYDRFSKRWFFTCETLNLELETVSDLLLVVNDDSVIKSTTSWSAFVFANDELVPQYVPLGQADVDYQQLAIDQNNVYVSFDTFDTTSTIFQGVSFLVIDKESLFTGAPQSKVFAGLLNGPITGEFTPPADNFDRKPQFGYFIHANNSDNAIGGTYDQLQLFKVVNGASSSSSLVGPLNIPVASFADPQTVPHKGNLFGTPGFLQVGIGSGLTIPHVRNKQLFACHAIQVDKNGTGILSGDRVGVRWYQFDLTGDPEGKGQGEETALTIPALVQYGTIYDSDPNTSTPLFYFNPAIMTNKLMDVAIGGTVCGENAYTNVFYSRRSRKDKKGSMRAPLVVTKNKTNAYNSGFLASINDGVILGQRWGDASSMSPDPVNDLDIWGTQEFAAIQNGWGVQTTQLLPLKGKHSQKRR